MTACDGESFLWKSVLWKYVTCREGKWVSYSDCIRRLYYSPPVSVPVPNTPTEHTHPITIWRIKKKSDAQVSMVVSVRQFARKPNSIVCAVKLFFISLHLFGAMALKKRMLMMIIIWLSGSRSGIRSLSANSGMLILFCISH